MRKVLFTAVVGLGAVLLWAGSVRIPGPGGVVLPPPPADTCNVAAFTQAAIQTQLNACPSGGTVFLPAGTYTMTGTAVTWPSHPITVTGVRALSKLTASGGTFFDLGNGATVTNLTFIHGCIINDGNGTTMQYNQWLDPNCIYGLQDNSPYNGFYDHNISKWTSVCTALCNYGIYHWYSSLISDPQNVQVSYNYVDGYWEGIQFEGYQPGDRGSNINVNHNILLHGLRMAIEDGTPIDTHLINNNYINGFVTISGAGVDTTCEPPNQIAGSYDCNAFGISVAGGGSTGMQVNNNRMYGSGTPGAFNPFRTGAAWGIEFTAQFPAFAANNIIQQFSYGFWDDAADNPTFNRPNATSNTLCNIFYDYTRMPSADGWPPSNTYSASCPAPAAIPCPPFDPTTGGSPSGCTPIAMLTDPFKPEPPKGIFAMMTANPWLALRKQ